MAERLENQSPGGAVGWHFGFNCRNFLPTLGKCRVLHDLYSRRSYLLSGKWITSEDLLVYLALATDEVLRLISNGEIGIKRLKADGSPRFLVRAPWAWDACPLVKDGGRCFDFEAHEGEKISCLEDLYLRDLKHPNLGAVPTPGDIAAFEARLPDAPTLD